MLIGRLLQGFSAGAELGGVSVYLAEIATSGRKGFYTSWQSGSQQVAIMVAAAMGFALNAVLEPSAISDWGWRIPFLFGCLIVPFIFILRRKLEETRGVYCPPPSSGDAPYSPPCWRTGRWLSPG